MSERRCRALAAAALLMALFAAGCGFRPLYGERSGSASEPITADLAAVEVARIPDRPGQMLRNELNDLLNPARITAPTRFTLAVSLQERAQDAALDRSGLATRNILTLDANWSLADSSSGTVLLASRSRSTTSFNVLSGQPQSQFSSLTSRQDARGRAINAIAYDIRSRLATYFGKHPGGAAPPPGTARLQAVEPAFTPAEPSPEPLGSGLREQ